MKLRIIQIASCHLDFTLFFILINNGIIYKRTKNF